MYEFEKNKVDNAILSTKSRTEKPGGYPERFLVPDDRADWKIPFYEYNPQYYVADVVIRNDRTINAQGWADPEDISQINHDFHSYEGPVVVNQDGYPQNPLTRTGIKGRGELGNWGANFAADPIISRINPDTGTFEIAVIRRKDNGQWAIPGGMVDADEDVSRTIEREFEEEAGASIDMSKATLIYQGYVDDRRNTDNAWMETTVKHLHLPDDLAKTISLEAGDDAGDVRWLEITPESIDNLYASHGMFIKLAIQKYLADNEHVLDSIQVQLENIN